MAHTSSGRRGSPYRASRRFPRRDNTVVSARPHVAPRADPVTPPSNALTITLSPDGATGVIGSDWWEIRGARLLRAAKRRCVDGGDIALMTCRLGASFFQGWDQSPLAPGAQSVYDRVAALISQSGHAETSVAPVAPDAPDAPDAPTTPADPVVLFARATSAAPEKPKAKPKRRGKRGGKTPEGKTPEGKTPEGKTPEGKAPEGAFGPDETR